VLISLFEIKKQNFFRGCTVSICVTMITLSAFDMSDALFTNKMIALTRKDSSGLGRHVHANAALQVAFEGHHGSSQKVFAVRRDFEGALLLLLEVVDVSADLFDALDERFDVLVVQMSPYLNENEED
jgi:hypothetical protein